MWQSPGKILLLRGKFTMKAIKTMLLGIALLAVAACGAPLFAEGVAFGGVMFLGGLMIGLILVIRGFFYKE